MGVLATVLAVVACGTTSTGPSPSASSTAAGSQTPSDTGAPTQPPAATAGPGVTSTVAPVPPVQITPVQTTPPTRTTAPYPAAGTTFGGEGITGQAATDLQKAVDAGHQPWRLDRIQVAEAFVQQRFGWTNTSAETGAPMVVFVNNGSGGKVALHLVQPATAGDHGIWVVDSGVWS